MVSSDIGRLHIQQYVFHLTVLHSCKTWLAATRAAVANLQRDSVLDEQPDLDIHDVEVLVLLLVGADLLHHLRL